MYDHYTLDTFMPPPNSVVIYATYGNGNKDTKLNKKQAKVIKEQYQEKYGGVCEIYEVRSAEDFVNTWNSLDDSYGIDAIQVISHGSVGWDGNSYGIGNLMFGDGSNLYSSSFEGLTGGNKSIDDVNSKNVNSIYFSACNTANPDFNSNIMTAFYNKNTSAKSVTGWDGGVTFRFHQRGLRSFLSGNFQWTVNKDFSVAREEQHTFDTFMNITGNIREPGKRELTRD